MQTSYRIFDNTVRGMPIAKVLQGAQKSASFFQTSKHIFILNFLHMGLHGTNKQFIIKLSLRAMIAIHPLASSLSAVKTSEQPHEFLHFI